MDLKVFMDSIAKKDNDVSPIESIDETVKLQKYAQNLLLRTKLIVQLRLQSV